jgi:ABC-type Fe3+-hydroxamate transport system substrate-binding protein
MRAAAAAAIAIAALLLLTACGQRSEPVGPKVELYPVTVEQATGPPVVLTRRPTRIAALTPQAASLLSSVLDRRVPVSAASDGADLVVTTPEGLNARPKGAYTAPDASIDSVERALTDLGLLLDRPIRSRELVEEIERNRRLVRDRLKGVKPVTVFVDTGFFTTVSTKTLLGNLITEAGGTNVAGSGPQVGQFDVQRLLQLNPDYYLATSDSGTTLEDLRRDRRTRKLRAVREGHFARLGPKVVQPGGHVGTKLLAIARYLHKDAFR